MASFVEATLKDIDGRLRDLKQEVERLEAARAALSGARRGPGRPRGSSNGRRSATRTRAASPAAAATPRRRSRARGRRGGSTRANQALELVRSRPGITIPEIAKAMGIEPNYLYRVLPKLSEEGQIKRNGQGWHPGS
jgi:hypothetical protein